MPRRQTSHEDQGATRRYWIFQANPNKYRILDSLKIESEELWNLNQHSDDVCAGDGVLVWVSGDGAGIYARGNVIGSPIRTADTSVGQAYWIEAEQGQKVKPRVWVRYDQKYLDRPLLKSYLQADSELWSLRILQFPRGTNFPVEESEWRAIGRWLDQGFGPEFC